MARLQDLLAKKATLEREIADTQRKERSAAVGHIRTIMDQYGLSLADLSGKAANTTGRRGRPPGRKLDASASSKAGSNARSSSMKGKKVAAKYRNKATGDSWSGRGLQPRWLSTAIAAGKKLTDFAV